MIAVAAFTWGSNGQFLGVEWNTWKVIGWLGNVVFFSRFLVQWYATEKRKQVVVPVAFWWLSIFGSWLLLLYAIFYRKDSVFILANAFNWIPYIRNLLIHRRHQERLRSTSTGKTCLSCNRVNPLDAIYCCACGRIL